MHFRVIILAADGGRVPEIHDGTSADELRERLSAAGRVVLSVKARELDEEKKAMADFGSSDSGASLGDILGAALSRAQKKDE